MQMLIDELSFPSRKDIYDCVYQARECLNPIKYVLYDKFSSHLNPIPCARLK